MTQEKTVQQQSGSESIFAAAPRYLKDSVEELKKVHTPTRAETIQATMVTLFIMVAVSMVLFLLDVCFSRLVGALIPA